MLTFRKMVAVAVVLLAACGAPQAKQPARSDKPLTPTARDTAGVRVVEHPADALERAPLLALDSTPIATLGKGDTLIDLSRVRSVLVLRDGSLAFYLDGAVHVYSAAGGVHQRFGREGAGPGEFRDGDLAWGRGDTILVTDASNSRISWLVPGQGVVRSRAVKLNRPGIGFGAVGQGDHDTLIMATTTYFPQFAGVGQRTKMPVGVLTGASDSIVILVPLEGGEMRAVPELATASMPGQASVRYPPMPQAGWWGDGFLAVRPDHWQLDRFRPSGQLRFSVRILKPRVAMSSELRARDIAGSVAALKAISGAPPDTSSLYKRFALYPYPDSLPAFGDVTITPGGIAWVRDQGLRADTTWAVTAVGADGRLLGRLLGHGHAPIGFGDDRVVFRDLDADGLASWRVIRIRWMGGGK